MQTRLGLSALVLATTTTITSADPPVTESRNEPAYLQQERADEQKREVEDLLTQIFLEQLPLQTDNDFTLVDLVAATNPRLSDSLEIAQYFESVDQILNSFAMYELVNDRDNMERIAKAYFVDQRYGHIADDLMNRIGLEITPEMYTARGDNLLLKAVSGNEYDDHDWLQLALEAYIKGKNSEKINEVVDRLGKINKLGKAFGVYRHLDDLEGAVGICVKMFTENDDSRLGANYLWTLDLVPTQKLWELRGRELAKRAEYNLAIESYRNGFQATEILGYRHKKEAMLHSIEVIDPLLIQKPTVETVN